MYTNTSLFTMCRIHVRVIPLTALLLTLLHLPAPLLAQRTGGSSQIEALVESSDDAPSLPLTTAQEQAKQLATVLIATQEAAPSAKRSSLLGVVTDQAMRPGTRVVLPLFTAQGIEGRLVSAEQTFASPVEDDGVTVTVDARRPLFLPASNTALAFEILVE